mgnify:CR=1 FL=1
MCIGVNLFCTLFSFCKTSEWLFKFACSISGYEKFFFLFLYILIVGVSSTAISQIAD